MERWISCNYRMPAYGECVWVYDELAIIKQYSTFYMPYPNDDYPQGIFTNNGHTPIIGKITHWRRLMPDPIPEFLNNY